MARKKTDVHEPAIKVGRCRRGSLENLPNMPLDIVVETMSYLQPTDILHLARTTKDFRAFLMARSSEFVWRRARNNVEGLPPCPNDLSEPAYANLAFDTHCHQCLAPGVKMVLWELRARYCPACRKEKFLARAAIIKRFPVLNNLGLYVFEVLFPSIPYGSRGSQFYMPYVEDYVNSLPQEHLMIHFSLSQGWQEQPDMKAKIQHAVLCEEWQGKLKDTRQNELQDIRERRRAEIFRRLEVLGWGEELGFMQELGWDDLNSHPRLNEPKELTDKVWDKIKPTFEDIMTKTRALRLILERKLLLGKRLILFNSVYADWRRDQPLDVVLPQAIEFATKDEVRNLISVPEADVITKQCFYALRDMFPQWIDEWHRNCDSTLCAEYSYPPGMEHVPDDIDLNLATTVWLCPRCPFPTPKTMSILHYPEVLEHQCMHQRAECHEDDFVFPQDEAEVASRLVNEHSPWTCAFVKPQEAPLWASEVVKACGMDPLTATREQMDALDVRLSCNACILDPLVPSTIDTLKVYNWRAAIRHHAMHWKKDALPTFIFRSRPERVDNPPVWERVEDSRLLEVKRLEAQASHFYDPYTIPPTEIAGYLGTLHCSLCPRSGLEQDELDDHFHRCHADIIDANEPKGYFDRSLRYIVPSPVMLVSGTEADLRARITAEPHDRVARAASTWLEQGRAGFLNPDSPEEAAVHVASS